MDLFWFDVPGLSYAIDPITIALLAGSAAVDYFSAQEARDDAQSDVNRAEAAARGSVADLAKERYKKSQDDANLEAMMTGFRSVGMEPLQTVQAQTLEALGTGGERALMMGATPLASQSVQAQTAAQDMDFARELQGRQVAAERTAEIDAANAAASQQAATLQAQLNQDALMQAQANLGQTEADLASSLPESLAAGLQLHLAQVGAEDGGKIEQLVAGGKPVVQKLDGPEDHDKKKFAIMESGAVIDEDNGEKVAEATGQEYILNSKQAKGIHDEYDTVTEKIKSGKNLTEEDWMAFYKAVDAVFSLPQFNEETA